MTTRLSRAESSSLYMQTSTTPAHTVSVIVLEASEQFSHDRLSQWVAMALPRLARFRSRLVGKPLGAGQPVWAEIDDRHPGSQIHRATAPAPGGERQLADLVTNLTSGPQHWRTWLWEAWTIDGLAGGRWALAVKTSSVLSGDSSASTAIRDCLLTSAPASESGAPTEIGPGPRPSLRELVVDTLSEMVENQITGMWMVAEAVTGVLLAARRGLQDAQEPTVVGALAASSTSPSVPLTVLAAPLTDRRSMAFVSLPAADVKVISDAFGGNTANVVLAACTLSLRAWLQRHDAVPADALVMEVPLSLPAGDPAGAGGTVATGRVRIPVQLDDPVQVLTNLHTATERLNIANRAEDEEVPAAVDFASAVSLLPPWAARAGMQVYRSLGLPGSGAPRCHGSVSFAAESVGPLFCAGAEVVGLYTAEPMVERRGLSISVTSHADVMDVCVTACPDNVPCVDDFASGIDEALQVLLKAAERSPRGEGRSVVTEMTSHHGRSSRA
jgi:diacylglycerol O-acyltransferase